MAPNPVSLPRSDISNPSSKKDSLRFSTPLLFAGLIGMLVALYDWPRRWLLSGAGILNLQLLIGAANGYRVLPVAPLWTLLATLNLAYSIANTSWLLFGLFNVGCYLSIFLSSLWQYNFVSRSLRNLLRKSLGQLHFVNDKIAFFDIPALEIDVDVQGLMVVRGISITLSTLTIVAHGIEVGIKLSDDLELAIQTERVTIPLFRKIVIEDCFANIKGGKYEMTFGTIEASKGTDATLMVENTALLKSAAVKGDMSTRPGLMKMTSQMTHGKLMEDASAETGLKNLKRLSPSDDKANQELDDILAWIESTSLIAKARKSIEKAARESNRTGDFNRIKKVDLRAAITSELHQTPSVPHPPKVSVKVTTLQNLSPPWLRRLLHRLPMLLRLLLNPISYFHPVTISSITAAGSGKWITHMLKDQLFKNYVEGNAELRRLEDRISTWLSDARFALQLADIKGIAHVPFLTAFDITCLLGITDVLAYRMATNETNLQEVVRLGGADARFEIPSYLLPHHEHLLPPIPDQQDLKEVAEEAEEADGKPKFVQKLDDLEQMQKDEANVNISIHARLPAVVDQELLDFIAALVKATKVIELEKEPEESDEKPDGLFSTLNQNIKDSAKKVLTQSIVRDKLIAKLVGKFTTGLETMKGEVGYSGQIPVKLADYRLPENHPEAIKILA